MTVQRLPDGTAEVVVDWRDRQPVPGWAVRVTRPFVVEGAGPAHDSRSVTVVPVGPDNTRSGRTVVTDKFVPKRAAAVEGVVGPYRKGPDKDNEVNSADYEMIGATGDAGMTPESRDGWQPNGATPACDGLVKAL